MLDLDPEFLATSIHALRVAVLVTWAYVTINGMEPMFRIIVRKQISGDKISATMLVLGLSLITFQCRALSRGAYASADVWTLIGLGGLLLTAALLFLIRCRSVHDEHKRAAILSGIGILLFSLVAGALS